MKNIKKDDFYSQYIGVIKNVPSLAYFSKPLIEAGVRSNIYIQDISVEEPNEKSEMIGKILVAERMRGILECSEPFFYNLIRTKEQTYVLIISVSGQYEEEHREEVKRILHLFFSISHGKSFGEYSNRLQPAYRTRKMMSGYLEEAFADEKGMKTFGKGETYEIERFSVENIPEEYIERLSKVVDRKMTALLDMSLGKTLCACLDTGKLFINQIRDFGVMNSAPVLYKENYNLGERFEFLEKQLSLQEESVLAPETFYEEAGKTILGRLSVSTHLLSHFQYSRILRQLSEDVVYRIPAVQLFDTPLYVQFAVEEGRMNVTYLYDRKAMSGINIENLHLNFSSVFRLLLVERKDIEISKLYEIERIEAEIKRKKRVMEWLHKQESFKEFSEEMTEELYKICDFACLSCYQLIMTKGTKLNRIFLLANGRVEVSGNSPDGYANPLYMLKKGELFGIEALFGDAVSPVHYRAVSNDVLLLAFERDGFLKLCQKKPEVYVHLLKIQSDRLHRMERLWLGV